LQYYFLIHWFLPNLKKYNVVHAQRLNHQGYCLFLGFIANFIEITEMLTGLMVNNSSIMQYIMMTILSIFLYHLAGYGLVSYKLNY